MKRKLKSVNHNKTAKIYSMLKHTHEFTMYEWEHHAQEGSGGKRRESVMLRQIQAIYASLSSYRRCCNNDNTLWLSEVSPRFALFDSTFL
jgi:hypothetical protein